MGTWPQFSYPYDGIVDKLNTWGGNNSPMPYASGKGGVSGLMPWIRVISAYGCEDENGSANGLVMQSNYPQDGFNIRYGNGATGNSAKSGICGFELNMEKPVEVKGRPTRPSPIISGLSVSEADVGRKTTNFSITCYTLEHMEKIAKYFLEPGFYVLVEWGWNTRDARKQWVGGYDAPGAITPCMMTQYMNVGHVSKKRIQSNFEYDATLGLTTSGGVKFGDNETYIIDVVLVSQGDVASYMQGHKGSGDVNNVKAGSGLTFKPSSIDASADGDAVGDGLFKQMFNDLISEKQTSEVMKWRTTAISWYDKSYAFIEHDEENDDNKWADASNFVNMDKVIQTNILDVLKKQGSIKSEGSEDFEFPEDKPFLSNERFIRFELAMAILNADGTKKTADAALPKDVTCSSNKVSHVINTDTSIIGAFPSMFSTDKNILYIPNTTAPKFNLDAVFSGKKADEAPINYSNLLGEGNTQNLHPIPTTGINYTGTRKWNNAGFTGAPHAFPSTYNLIKKDNHWNFDEVNGDTIQSYEHDANNWGWLKNLYINFDFFCQTMKSPNYTIRDVLYDLLNGMSAACNSHWKFQIVERPHPNTGTKELQVVDLNFTGIINHTESKIPTFQSRGTTSPFLNVDFNVSAPAAMMNNVLQKRHSNDPKAVEPKQGSLVTVLGSVWSNPKAKDNDGIKPVDMVGTIISGVKYVKAVEGEEDDEPTEEQIKTTNYEAFVGKAGIYPRNQNRNNLKTLTKSIKEGKISDVFMIGTYADSQALRNVYMKNMQGAKYNVPGSPNEGKVNNVAFGVAGVDFTVLGMSGFKRGDTMRFSGLPRNFSDPHTYEVTGLEHTITTTGWETKVITQMRPYGQNKAGK